MENKRFDVVLSFAGEDRSYVNEVAQFLKSKSVSHFYDKDDELEIELWGKEMTEEFDRIYRLDSRYAVLFISEHYERKMWPRHERRSALARALEERGEYVLPARFDDTEIEGLRPSTNYFDLRLLTPTEFAIKICKKIGKDISASKLNAVPTPGSESKYGKATFDYSNHDGKYGIGSGDLLFETRWSRASDTSIHCYNDTPTVVGIAMAPKGSGLKDITDASKLDYTSRTRTPGVGDFVVLQNVNGFYAAVEIVGIKDNTRSDAHDELSFRYWILNDGSEDFSQV